MHLYTRPSYSTSLAYIYIYISLIKDDDGVQCSPAVGFCTRHVQYHQIQRMKIKEICEAAFRTNQVPWSLVQGVEVEWEESASGPELHLDTV